MNMLVVVGNAHLNQYYSCMRNLFSPHVCALVRIWGRLSLINKMTELAARRKLDDLTTAPVLTFRTEGKLENMISCPRSRIRVFSGEALEIHSIPAIYGSIKPTAISVPIEEILKDYNYEP